MDALASTFGRNSQHSLHDIAGKSQISNIAIGIVGKSDTEDEVCLS